MIREHWPSGILTLGLAASILLTGVVGSAPAAAQVWQTAANNPGDNTYYLPEYPIVFVTHEIVETTTSTGLKGEFSIGTDVLLANRPDGGNQLWILLPSGLVKLLFPLPNHVTDGLIDSALADLDKGTVVEPSISEDGRKLYLSYFHDADTTASQTKIPISGADLYRIDLGPLLDDETVDPATLPVLRLTSRTYLPSGYQDPGDWQEEAMNWTLAQNTSLHNWGTVYMHPTEMRKEGVLKLVYASDERRMRNSNTPMDSYANHNFNLHMAEVADDGTLDNKRQFQYYTTTSALSPTPLRDGIAFSYQASTEDARNWHIQKLDSAGRWEPLMGYGTNPELFHLGSLCIDTLGSSPGDYFVATRYYNQNNEGFGALYKQDLSLLGVNTYLTPANQTTWGMVPKQVGSTKITQGVNSNDFPAPKVGGQYVGKMTSPRCGKPNELFMAYSPTSANSRLNDPDGDKSIYHPYIGFRPNLDPFNPLDPVNPSTGSGLRIVIDDSSDDYGLVWPVPVLSWFDRTGDLQQQSAPSAIDKDSTVAPGLPYAQVGTAALWNTDRRPFDCYLSLAGAGDLSPYSPNESSYNINQEFDLILGNQDGLTMVQDPANPCLDVTEDMVLGVAVNVTSNRAYMQFGYTPGYDTDSGRDEVAKLLGVYDVRNQIDQSFQAVIPANTPFEFHLLDRTYGMKLTDVRSWHSLQARETRTNCGGCHQHEQGQTTYSFDNTYADLNPPLDMVGGTPHLAYDANCQPVFQTDSQASRHLPEWTTDVYPKLNQYCGSCHNSNQNPGNPPAVQAFGYTNEQEAYNEIAGKNYGDGKQGALSSPVWWAARGMRTDGRNNADPKFQKDLANNDWGFYFSSIHATAPDLCGSGDPVKAQWVYDLGTWIDNHMPRNRGVNQYDYHFDWYHPTVDSAIKTATCAPTSLRIGFWDDTGSVQSITVEKNGSVVATFPGQPNGFVNWNPSGLIGRDVITVIAEDAAGNRQRYSKRVSELKRECRLRTVQVVEQEPCQVGQPC